MMLKQTSTAPGVQGTFFPPLKKPHKIVIQDASRSKDVEPDLKIFRHLMTAAWGDLYSQFANSHWFLLAQNQKHASTSHSSFRKTSRRNAIRKSVYTSLELPMMKNNIYNSMIKIILMKCSFFCSFQLSNCTHTEKQKTIESNVTFDWFHLVWH